MKKENLDISGQGKLYSRKKNKDKINYLILKNSSIKKLIEELDVELDEKKIKLLQRKKPLT